MKKFLYQSYLLLFSCGIVFLWDKTPLAELTLPLLIVLIIISFSGIFLWRKLQAKKEKTQKPIMSQVMESFVIFIVITVLLLVIFATGKLSSNLFFLLYFVTFGIVFVFEPATVFVFAIGVVAIFLPDIITNAVSENIIKTASLILVSPLAFFFGKEYIRESEFERKNK